VSRWETVRLSKFCRTGTGGTPSRRQLERYYESGTIPWVKSGELRETVITQTEEHITEAALRETNVKLVPQGALLLAMYGATVGRLGILGVEATTNQAVCHIIPDPNRADLRFMFHALANEVPSLIARGVGGAQPNISQGLIKDLDLRLPPVAEQRRIADVLDRAEALRTKRRAALAQLDSLTQSIFFDLFGDPVISERTIGELLETDGLRLHKDGNHGSLYPRADDFVKEGVPFLTAKALSDDGHINNSLIENLRTDKAAKLRIGWIERGDVLLAHNASVGKVALYDGRFDRAMIGTSLTAFRPNPSKLDSHYLAAELRSARFQRELEKIMGQTTRNQVPITAQRELKILVPPVELQREFARRVLAVERLKAAQRASLAEMDALFASLQHRAFRGEL
jgi:type I restriction enzyme, S subunit